MNERNGSLREIKNDRFLKTNLFERTSKKLSFFSERTSVPNDFKK